MAEECPLAETPLGCLWVAMRRRAGTMLKAKPTADNQLSVGLVGGDILVFPPIFMLFCVLVGIALRYAVGPLLPVPVGVLHS